MPQSKLLLPLTLALLAHSTARADGFVILDHRGFGDTVYGFTADEGGRLYTQVSADAGSSCGVLATDANGTLLATFGEGGRLPVSSCPSDTQGEPGGGLRQLV